MGTPNYSSSLYNPTQPWSSLDTDDWIKNDTWCKEYQPVAHWTISYSLSVSLIWTKKHRETPLIRCLRGLLETEHNRDLVEVDRSIQTLCKQGELERFGNAWKIQNHSVPGFLWGTQLNFAFYVNKWWPSAIRKKKTSLSPLLLPVGLFLGFADNLSLSQTVEVEVNLYLLPNPP